MPKSRNIPWLGYWLGLALMVCFALPAFAQEVSAPSDAAEPEQSGPAYATLADLLENEASRQRLIEELRALAKTTTAGERALPGEAPSAEAVAEQAPSDQSPEQVSLARRLAELTSSVAGDIGSQFKALAIALGGLFAPQVDVSPGIDSAAVMAAAINLGLVIIATFAVFFILRRLGHPLFSRISRWSQASEGRSALLRLIGAVAVAALIDVLIVALAYIGGNLIATFAIGDNGSLSTQASLFLNAFLIIELVKAAIRMLFSSHYEGLRLVPIATDEAKHWNRWLATLTGFVGYGMLVLVPIINFNLSPALGQGAGLIIMLLAFIYATLMVLKNRTKVRAALEAKAEQATMSPSRVALRLLGKVWHLLAIVYFLVVLLVSIARPEDALPSVAAATLQTLIIAGLGLLLSGVLTQLIGRRITLSDDLRRKLPKLEARLNAYIPTFLKIIRAIILIAVTMLILNAWGVFDLAAWYATDAGRGTVSKLTDVIIILVVACALWIALASLIEHRLNPETGSGEPTARAKTLLSLFRNALAIALITMTAMIVLAEIGINIGPLIAGAGVIGLAIGFGAQKLVQDIITGVFIQVENAMNTGDVVTVGGVTGTAERLSIRSVGIRDLAGTYHIVPFSSVDTVSNYMREFGNHVGEYGIAYRESIDDAIAQLELAFEDLKSSEEHGHKLLAPLTVAGVIALADSSVNIRVVIKTTPGDQWGVGRAYNRLVKLRFDAAGIEIPFPHTTLYFGEDKNGGAPPANIRLVEERRQAVDTREADDASGDAAPPVYQVSDPSHRKPDSDDIDDPQDR
ncbi:mechanosensitive channel protein [Halomonas sp. HP20-15]|uniref:mechanosensitive channel protein n=1 Tax=Halomonas sp. HP20-15 TaxID=3085901 RepID=UPI002982A194|nr:mechanosensitive channel protein [Halomonas sp. HP20-15]MDW5376131.1 mechanosensitive channel protein [Halomonas sp. HP20-15]